MALSAQTTRLEASGGGQLPPAAVQAPDHTCDLTMANAELAAINVDDEAEEII